jgi:hypothetical protein
MTSKTPASKGLTAPDVCLIIKECKDAGLAEFHWGDLQIIFWAKVQQIPTPTHVPEAILERQAKIEQEDISDQELLTREEQLMRLQVENPVEYERMLSSGDLEMNSMVGDADGKEAGQYRT